MHNIFCSVSYSTYIPRLYSDIADNAETRNTALRTGSEIMERETTHYTRTT
jgi:hypothetical protein